MNEIRNKYIEEKITGTGTVSLLSLLVNRSRIIQLYYYHIDENPFRYFGFP